MRALLDARRRPGAHAEEPDDGADARAGPRAAAPASSRRTSAPSTTCSRSVKLLVEHGVDVNAANDAGQTALHFRRAGLDDIGQLAGRARAPRSTSRTGRAARRSTRARRRRPRPRRRPAAGPAARRRCCAADRARQARHRASNESIGVRPGAALVMCRQRVGAECGAARRSRARRGAAQSAGSSEGHGATGRRRGDAAVHARARRPMHVLPRPNTPPLLTAEEAAAQAAAKPPPPGRGRGRGRAGRRWTSPPTTSARSRRPG